MKSYLIGVLLAAVIVLALLPATGIAARSCGGGVTVTGSVPCWKAKSIVREFKKTRKRHIQGYTCAGTSSGGRLTKVTCRLQERVIRWTAY